MCNNCKIKNNCKNKNKCNCLEYNYCKCHCKCHCKCNCKCHCNYIHFINHVDFCCNKINCNCNCNLSLYYCKKCDKYKIYN